MVWFRRLWRRILKASDFMRLNWNLPKIFIMEKMKVLFEKDEFKLNVLKRRDWS